MENQGNNGICPNCGMFLKDGVCPECGYSAANVGMGMENDQPGQMQTGTAADESVEGNAEETAGNEAAQAENSQPEVGAAQEENSQAESGAGLAEGSQSGIYEGNNYQQGGFDQNAYYQQGGVNTNGGYYQQGGANTNGYYQQGGANGNGGYYQQGGANTNGGYYQQGGANTNGYYQQGGANANGYYQQGGANTNGYYQQNGANQNGYYQNPQGQNGYNGYNSSQPTQKSGSKGAVIAAVVGGILLLILVIALIFVVTVGLGKDDKDRRADDGGNVERDLDDEKDNDDRFSDLDDDDSYDPFNDDDYDYDDDYDPYADDDYDPLEFLDDIDWDDESWKDEPYNYAPEDVGDEFYYELCNCIDRNVDYRINFETFEDSDESQNICMRINYYQLDGDIPNLETINEALKETAMYYNTYYNDNIDDYEDIFAEYGSGYVVDVDSFVTYNDEEKISVVMNEYYESPVEINKHVVSLNIDLEAGIILYNTDFFDISEEFLEYYRDTCRDQNGSVPALREFDNDELRRFFEDEDDLILYYTPCGFEVGINYETDESYGWVTATLVDCEQYLQSY